MWRVSLNVSAKSAKPEKKKRPPPRKSAARGPREVEVSLPGADAVRNALFAGEVSVPNHAMLDLETLGKKPGCIILSIGVVKFDPFKDNSLTEIMDGQIFYAMPDRHEQQEAGLELDISTVDWWIKQGDKAKEAFGKDQMPVAQVLDDLDAFLRGVKRVWCNGPSFDTPIIRELYNAFKREFQMPYYNDLDMRTMKMLAGGWNAKVPEVDKLVAHDALQDAIKQAVLIQRYMRMARTNLNMMFDDE